MPEIGKWQRQFLLLLFLLWLSIRGRHNFANLARYGQYNEGAYRKNFSKAFDWLTFNRILCEKALGSHAILAFDPSYISKSGKHTDGVGKFWSGCAGQVKHGLEISAIAAVDLDNNAALHLAAFQTLARRAGQSLLDYYAEGITKRKEALLQVSEYLVADAYFSKAPFIDRFTEEGFVVVSRLRTDAKMRYFYRGAKEKKKGRPKVRSYSGCAPTSPGCVFHLRQRFYR